VIDGYEVVSLLGRGGMGAVYRVRRGETDFALKTLALAVDDASEEVQRFRREAELLGLLRHPGLVRVSSAGAKPGFFYFIMRLIEGESLEERLKRTGPLPVREAVRIALAVADAIAHAHEKGVIHRDLKPANVLMERDGDRPVVTDFGLGRRLGESDAERLTRTGEVMGTPSFIAPEQAFGLKSELDEKTDVYGLGALLYTLLSGEPPFDGPSALVVMKKVSTEPPPPLKDVPETLEAFVQRAMAKRREDRPPSARAFAEELRAAMTARRVSRAALAAFAAALVLLAATALFVNAWRRSGGLATRVAALRVSLEDRPLLAAREEAGRRLAGVPSFARQRFTDERSREAQKAFEAEAWAEARDAAFECWLAAPEPPAAMEPILIASLAEIAATASDEASSARLLSAAGSAEAAALPAARDALCERIRARTGELVAATSTSATAWAGLARRCEAAERLAPPLPDDCERIRVAALVVSGQGDARLLAGCDPASLRAPPLVLAAQVLYAEALAAPDGEPRRRALERLEKIPPPAVFEAAVSDVYWRSALERYFQYRESLIATFSSSYAEISGSSHPDKLDMAIRTLTRGLGEVLQPLGRAFAAKPDREPLPNELGELVSTIRLMTNVNLLMGQRHEPYWSEAIKTLGDHPIALYVRGRLLANRSAQTRDHWDPSRIEELRSLAKKLLPQLREAPHTEHVRALALHFVEKVLFDDTLFTSTLYAGVLEDAPPFLEIADYDEAWTVIAGLRRHAKDEAQALEADRLANERERFPDYLSQLPKFIQHGARRER